MTVHIANDFIRWIEFHAQGTLIKKKKNQQIIRWRSETDRLLRVYIFRETNKHKQFRRTNSTTIRMPPTKLCEWDTEFKLRNCIGILVCVLWFLSLSSHLLLSIHAHIGDHSNGGKCQKNQFGQSVNEFIRVYHREIFFFY